MTERKTSRSEEEYFAREEAEKLHRLHKAKLDALSEQEAEERKKLHHMKCSKCGYDLETINWRDFQVDKCFHCGAVVLDEKTLEGLVGAEDDISFFREIFALFR